MWLLYILMRHDDPIDSDSSKLLPQTPEIVSPSQALLPRTTKHSEQGNKKSDVPAKQAYVNKPNESYNALK
jgi:hypothetical protein